MSDLPISVGGSMRTVIGVVLIGSAHIITPTMGPGVVKLPWAVSHLGWTLAPFVIIFFSIATYYTFTLQASCIRGDDNNIDYTYMDAVKDKLGEFRGILFVIIQGLNIMLTAIGYTIEASKSMEEVIRSGCFHSEGHHSSCKFSINPFMIAFGAVQIILSQIWGFDEIWWLPIVAALMSFTYPIIGLGLGIAKVAENGIRGSLKGATGGEAQKIWTIFQALGNIAYAYSIIFNLNEIRERIKSPASESNTMEKAMVISVAATSVLKALCALLGYAAYGDASPENFLIDDFALACWPSQCGCCGPPPHCIPSYLPAVVHFRRENSAAMLPRFQIRHRGDPGPNPGLRKLNQFRLFWRTIFVIITTCLAMLIPFFNDVVGILGPLRFWVLTVYFPVEIYIREHGIGKWSRKWMGLQTLNAASFIVSFLAVLGSVVALVSRFKKLNTH